MKYDKYGRTYTTSNELCELLYKNPELDLSLFQVEDPQEYNKSKHELHADVPRLSGYVELAESIESFDSWWQHKWHMPDEYKQLDIAKHVLDLCSNEAELQRVGHELLLYQERGLFDLLRYLKYLVDTMREHRLIWGVGRGSSVASFVLYKMGLHQIDSLFYDLDPGEFLR